MTRDELITRTVYIEATPRTDRAKPMKVRSRGANIIQEQTGHPSEDFDDFFDYEKEMLEMTPARNTVSLDLDHVTPNAKVAEKEEELEEINTGFIVMEKKQEPIIEKNDNIESDNIESNNVEAKTSYEFIQCQFSKENGERCKKQAKKGQEFCATHKRFVAKHN